MKNDSNSIEIAIAWCLAWGEGREPQFDLSVLQEMQRALNAGEEVPEDVREIVDRVQQLEKLEFPETLEKLTELTEKHSVLWESKIGLVYGGATKIKQYVFESAKLPDIRGASALLDRINLVDIPAFFGEPGKSVSVSEWLKEKENFPNLEAALIKELLVYYKGGNILAFCPAAFVDDLANAIEKRYTHETLTANSCAVGESFSLLEIRFGLLKQNIENTPWLDWYHQNYTQPLVQAYFGFPTNELERIQKFKNHKSFNELTTKLAVLFNQRRSGNDFGDRPSRRYPPMFETHPYLRRDESDRRSAIARISDLPGNPSLSESLVRKRIMGQIAKQEVLKDNLPNWFKNLHLDWQPTGVESWVTKFEYYLNKQENSQLSTDYYGGKTGIKEALSLREIGNACKGFVAYIYADGNNMGGYIQQIQTPQEYKKFSEDIFQATEQSVYKALAKHLKPHQLNNLTDPDNKNRNSCWIHPFEILAIGGDDVMLIVPADRALAIAKTIGEEFENLLLLSNSSSYQVTPRCFYHRYSPAHALLSECQLSMSAGVLITAEDTPIYYAQNLTNQLLKSAKKSGKTLKDAGYLGGTIDFLVMKSVTMISSNIESFRKEGLTMERGAKLKLYAAPYTLHEIGGLIESVKILKKAEFPKSQLYQIRSFLERGKQTTILNYRYFITRLKQGKAELRAEFEEAWCKPKDPENSGNLAPWMFDLKEGVYETIWRELLDVYDFIELEADSEPISEDLANMEVDS